MSNLIESMVFFPDRDVPDAPAGVESLHFTTSDGVRLHAWYGEHAPDAPTLVWSHGNGGNIAGRYPVLRALVAQGLNVLAYDYRGYGRSEGSPDETGVYRDAEAAWDHLRDSGVSSDRIVCFGESLGGAVSVRLALERPCAVVAVVSTFTSMRDVAWVHYGPLGALAGDRFDSLGRIDRIHVPFFAAHGDRDEIVPFGLGHKLYEAAPEPKRFFRAEGYGHNDVFAAPGLIEAIGTFVHEFVRRNTA